MKYCKHVIVGCVAIIAFTASTLLAGTVRYNLPELLGEHVYDGDFSLGRFAQVDTPFGFYSVDSARLVIEGTVTSGMARGDGVIREAVSFVLEPSVGADPSFANTITINTDTVSGPFHIDDVYPQPFHPAVIPLPNPDGYPPMSFWVRFHVGPRFGQPYPPVIVPIQPGELFLHDDGIIVDVPIVANVTTAYILMTGPGIVPEPGACLLLISMIPFLLRRWRPS